MHKGFFRFYWRGRRTEDFIPQPNSIAPQLQALVSPFLLDDSMDNMVEHCLNIAPDDKQADNKEDLVVDEFTSSSYNLLKELDPDSARRIHPNDHRIVGHKGSM